MDQSGQAKSPEDQPDRGQTPENEALSSAPTCFVPSSSIQSNHTPLSSTVVTLPRSCPVCGNRYPKEFRVCPRDATPLVDYDGQDPLIGAILTGTYQVTRLIGEGGMGRVYEARHTRVPKKRFAVKLLHEEMARQPELLTRFEREAQTALCVAHPNVVELVDVHHLDDGRPYIIYEYLEGEELGVRLERQKKLVLSEAIPIMVQICRALSTAHAQGVVHRDLKPENVYLVGDPANPQVKVLDFGISKQLDGGNKLTRTGTIMGTPAYMAPEQARGEAVDLRADVYSAGAILYRMLTGEKPYDGEDGAQVLTQVLTEEPPRPRSIDASIPERVELIIQQAMAREVAQRFPNMKAFEAELEELCPTSKESGACSGNTVSSTFQGPKGSAVKTLHVTRVDREIRSARPTLILATLLGYLTFDATLTTAASCILRATRGTAGRITRTESWLIVIAVGVATVTPLVLWIWLLESRIWRNTLRSVDVAHRCRTALVTVLITQGLLTLGVHFVEALVLQAPTGQLTGLYMGPIFVLSLITGGLTWWLSGQKNAS